MTKQYWNEEQDYYFFEVKNAPSKDLGNKIYTKFIHPIFTKMAETILRKYFLSKNNNRELAEQMDELISDAVAKAYVSIFKFNGEKGHKPFSYVQAVIKYYYLDVIAKSKYSRTAGSHTSSLSDLQKEYELFVREPEYDVYDIMVTQIKQRSGLNDIVAQALINCLETYRPTSRYFISYYLMTSTGLNHKKIRNRMNELRADKLYLQREGRTTNYLEKFFEEMKIKPCQKQNYEYLNEKIEEYDQRRKDQKTQAIKSTN